MEIFIFQVRSQRFLIYVTRTNLVFQPGVNRVTKQGVGFPLFQRLKNKLHLIILLVQTIDWCMATLVEIRITQRKKYNK